MNLNSTNEATRLVILELLNKKQELISVRNIAKRLGIKPNIVGLSLAPVVDKPYKGKILRRTKRTIEPDPVQVYFILEQPSDE